MSSRAIKVLIADDQSMVRGALALLIGSEPDIDVVAECANGAEVVDRLEAGLLVYVCVLDIEMPQVSGLDAARLIHERQLPAKVLIVTTFGRAGYLHDALLYGVSGFMVKDAPADELAKAIRKINSGLRVIDPELAMESMLVGANPLTPREQEVLRASAAGASAPEIARQLHLSPGTVRNHLSNAIAKTGAANRVDAARQARKNGWL